MILKYYLLSRTRKMLKIYLTIFCAVVLLVGIAVMSCGVFTIRYFSKEHFTSLSTVSYLIIFFGLIISLLAVLGLYGTINDKKYILINITTTLFVCFLISSLICVLLFSLRKYKVPSITDKLLKDHKEIIDDSFQVPQHLVECCGLQIARDFVMKWKNGLSVSRPSCLHQIDSNSTLIDNFVNFQSLSCNVSNISKYVKMAEFFMLCLASIQLLLFFAFVIYTTTLVPPLDRRPPKKTCKSIRKRESSHQNDEDLFAKEYLEIVIEK